MNRIKRCKVCGDQASGFNYQALTCDSCKVFYHRYGFPFLRKYKFSCKKSGNCEINIQTRRSCKHCRLEKCFTVGMTRSVKANSELVPAADSSSPIQINDDFEDFLKEIKLTQISSLLISPFTGLSSISLQNSLPLTDYERVKIDEILSAFTVVVDEQQLPIVRYSQNFYDSFCTGEIYIRMFIRFCKRLSAFTVLSTEDQLRLLKPFCYDILTIRFAFLLDETKGGWPVIMNENASETLFAPYSLESISKIIKHNHHLFIECYEFVRRLKGELEGDVMLRDLYTVLSMFKNLADSRLSCPEFLRYNFILYSRLLQRYLQIKYNSRQKATEKLEKLLQMATQFDKIRKYERILFATEMDRALVPPCYLELYDL